MKIHQTRWKISKIKQNMWNCPDILKIYRFWMKIQRKQRHMKLFDPKLVKPVKLHYSSCLRQIAHRSVGFRRKCREIMQCQGRMKNYATMLSCNAFKEKWRQWRAAVGLHASGVMFRWCLEPDRSSTSLRIFSVRFWKPSLEPDSGIRRICKNG